MAPGSFEDYATSADELDPRLAQIKRLYAEHKHVAVKNEGEARNAMNWFRDYIKTDEGKAKLGPLGHGWESIFRLPDWRILEGAAARRMPGLVHNAPTMPASMKMAAADDLGGATSAAVPKSVSGHAKDPWFANVPSMPGVAPRTRLRPGEAPKPTVTRPQPPPTPVIAARTAAPPVATPVAKLSPPPIQQASLAQHIAPYYANAPGGFHGAALRAVSNQRPIDPKATPSPYVIDDVYRPIPVTQFGPEAGLAQDPPVGFGRNPNDKSQALNLGQMRLIPPPAEITPRAAMRPTVEIAYSPDPRLQASQKETMEHELSHAR